jgi:thiol-disulfide isomerase/thioredoxin
MKKGLIIGIIVFIVVILLFVIVGKDTNSGTSGVGSGFGSGSNSGVTTGGAQGVGTTGGEWLNLELSDVRTDESFKISDFIGKPILIETFAVWCPTCTKQQRNIKELHEEVGDSVISISLDTDPNEDAEIVRNHVEENGFDWRYAISPEAMTLTLVDEFKTGIVSAPSAPMILICADGKYRKLGGFGARSAEKLKDEIASGC